MSLLQSFYNLLIGNIIDPQDDFTQRLRKSVFGFLFFPCSIISFIFAIFVTVAFQTYQSTAGFCLMTMVFIGAYFWMRHHRHVSDRLCTVYVWFFAITLCFSNYFVAPETDNKSLLFMTVFVALTLRIRFLPGFMIFSVLIQSTIDWNLAQISADRWYIAFPNAHVNMEFPVRLNSQLVGTFLLFLGAYLFYLQIKETEKQVNAQLAANAMTVRVLKVQRNYDCDKIDQILNQCKEDGVVDDEMIKLFQVMNSNLKSYKPFLPNYLFQDDSNNDEDDDDSDREKGDNNDDEGDISEGISAGRRNKKKNAGVVDDDSEGALSQASTSAVSARKSPNPSIGRKYRGGGLDGVSECSSRQSRRVGARPSRGGRGDSTTASTHNGSSFADPISSLSLAANLNKKRGALFTGRITVALVDLNLGRIFQQHTNTALPSEAVVSASQNGKQGNSFAAASTTPSLLPHSPEATSLSATVYENLINTLFSTAAAAKASIHSLIGDCAQLTWNATHSVPLGEVKAAVFFARLTQALKRLDIWSNSNNSINANTKEQFETNMSLQSDKLSGSIVATGAIFTGKATVHSLLTSGTQQRALVIEATWFPILNTLLKLAQSHKCVLMDGTTSKSATLEVDVVPVEHIITSPSTATLHSNTNHPFSQFTTSSDAEEENLFTIPHKMLYHHTASPHSSTDRVVTAAAAIEGNSNKEDDFSSSKNKKTIVEGGGNPFPSASSSDQQQPQAQSPSTFSSMVVYLLVSEKVRKDDEWMYQLQQDSLQQQEESATSGVGRGAVQLTIDRRLHTILEAMSRSQFGEAVGHVHNLMLEYQESLHEKKGGGGSPSSSTKRQQQNSSSVAASADGSAAATRTKQVLLLLHHHRFLHKMSDHCDSMLQRKTL